MKKLIIFSLMTLMLFGLSGCRRGDEDDRPVVYTTVYPMQYLVEMIAGDSVRVERVPGSNTHSEDFEWSSKEIISMKNSLFIFYVGADTDNYIPDNYDALFSSGSVELINMSDHLEYAMVCYDSTHVHGDEEPADDHSSEVCEGAQYVADPHFWLDPALMIEAAEVVRANLVAEFPDMAMTYNDNYQDLVTEFELLDAAYTEMSLEVTKPIITTSLLFNYWHEAYEIEIISLVQDAHSNNTTIGDFDSIITEAIEHDVQYILFEANASSPAGNTVLEALQETIPTATSATLHGLGTVTNDELESGETYLTLMYKNLEVLKDATK